MMMAELTVNEMMDISGGHHGTLYEIGHVVGDFVKGFLDVF
jgi:hypothetical protein